METTNSEIKSTFYHYVQTEPTILSPYVEFVDTKQQQIDNQQKQIDKQQKQIDDLKDLITKLINSK